MNMSFEHNVDADRRRAIVESQTRNYSEVHKALTALEYLGINVKKEKARYTEVREFLMEVMRVSSFRAEAMVIDDVIREARENVGGRVAEVGQRIADSKLAELKADLAVHGEKACEVIDSRREVLHGRYEELRPEIEHLSADDAITHGKVSEYTEFRALHRTWLEIRQHEAALLRARAIPSESHHGSAGDGRCRVGHDLWARREGRVHLELSDRPAAEVYAEAVEAFKVVEPTVQGYNPFDPRNDGGGIPRPQEAPEKVVHAHNL
ncbi:hypothetical protein TPB0596_32010 [Tsukamurella pulmonis]|nr:hypothetical protein TPB0596_32010 [Tsukamurella pulmonis]